VTLYDIHRLLCRHNQSQASVQRNASYTTNKQTNNKGTSIIKQTINQQTTKKQTYSKQQTIDICIYCHLIDWHKAGIFVCISFFEEMASSALFPPQIVTQVAP